MTEARKERDALLDRLGLREVALVSFDVGAARRSARAQLYQFLRGRVVVRSGSKGRRTYRYPGLAEQGVRVGQSVFLFPPDAANGLIARLRELRIRHAVHEVYVPS